MTSLTDIAGLIGVPYRVGGRDRDGMDCLGLVIAALGVLRPGLHVPDLWDAAREACAGGWRGEDVVPDGWAELPPASLWRPADVLWVHAAGAPNHLGVVVPGARFLHAVDPVGSCVTPLRRIARRIMRGVRPPEVLA